VVQVDSHLEHCEGGVLFIQQLKYLVASHFEINPDLLNPGTVFIIQEGFHLKLKKGMTIQLMYLKPPVGKASNKFYTKVDSPIK